MKRLYPALAPLFLRRPRSSPYMIALLIVFSIGLTIFFGGGVVEADTNIGTVPTSVGPTAVAVNEVTNRIYVANEGSGENSVTVIDAANNSTATVAVGTTPNLLAVNSMTNKIYVGNSGSDNVTIIDGTDNSTTTVAVAQVPRSIAINQVTNKIYVAGGSFSNGSVVIIDGATGATETVSVGLLPLGIAVNSLTNRIYTANAISDSVTVIDGATNATTTIAAGGNPQAIAVNEETNKIYTANFNSGTVTVINGANNSTVSVDAPFANRLAVNTQTNRIYVVNENATTVTVINGSNNSTTTIDAGSFPNAIALNPETNKVYIANRGPSDVTVIDVANNNAISLVSTGNSPWAFGINSITNRIYVANKGSASVTVIDGTNSPASPTATPSNTPTATATNTPTATPTNTPTATPPVTPTATSTETPSPTPVICTFSTTVEPADLTFTLSGGTGTVTITASREDCRWRAAVTQSPNLFIAITDSVQGTGNGAFGFEVFSNSTGFGRAGTIDLSSVENSVAVPFQTITVLQPIAGCTYRLSPAEVTYDSQGTLPDIYETFTVIAPPACDWTAVPNNSWIHMAPTSTEGNGTATILYLLNENGGPGSAYRQGTITIAGQRHVINQFGPILCPINYLCVINPALCSPPRIGSIYGFRDEVLAKSPRGQKYTEDYYRYAGEVTKLLIFNPRLLNRTRETMTRYRPVVESMLEGQRARSGTASTGETLSDRPVSSATIVTDGDLDDLDELLTAFSAEASESLRETIEEVKRDIRDPQVQSEFGIRVTRGEKRALPGEEQTLSGMVGSLFPFDLPLSRPLSVGMPTDERQAGDKAVPGVPAASADRYGQIPLSFEINRGQVDSRVKYLARGALYNLFLTRSEAVLSLPVTGEAHGAKTTPPDLLARLSDSNASGSAPTVHTVRMKLDGASHTPHVSAHNELPGKSNYLIGSDPSKWRTDISNYSIVEYKQVYRGVDLIYYGNQRQLEYDFKVAPGTDPKKIRMHFSGAFRMEIDSRGDLVMHTAAGIVRQHRPVIYQETNGIRQEIAGGYLLKGRDRVGFQVGEYDRERPLVIDPVLVYSTYLGGSGDDESNGITLDDSGNAYIIGYTDSTNFPHAGALQPTYGGDPQDVFVSKLNAAGTALVYSTYLGGNGQDNGSDIAVDGAGNAYITGYTGSTNFPTVNAVQPNRSGLYNAFVAKLNPTGSALTYSTYFGGTIGEFGSSIAVDLAGNAYVGGVTSSPDFPRVNPIQSTFGGNLGDAFVAKFDATGGQVVYSTFLGGNGNDGVTSIALDAAGNAYVTGVTFSSDFPTANPLQEQFGGGGFDAFAAKLDPTGTSLVYSTYLGGNDEDRGFRIGVDAAGNTYVAGQTLSPDFPVASALQPSFGGGSDAFVTKLDPAGAVSYSTFLGGSGLDGATGLAVDPMGKTILTGFSSSLDFPLAGPLQLHNNGGPFDAFVTKLNATGTELSYSTYLGGSGDDSSFDVAADQFGNAYVFGRTASADFPTAGPLQPGNGGGSYDVFIAKISDLATTAAGAQVSGRVLTATGQGVTNATVLLTGEDGSVRTARTSSFGYYRFDNVQVGRTYVLGVRAKRYTFAPRVVSLVDNISDLDFIEVP